jgi:hypothetical protein
MDIDTLTGPPAIASRYGSLCFRSAGYWVATAAVVGELGLGGIWDIARLPFVRELVTHLGYPSYFLVLLGTWKVLGAVALLVPRRALLKEWAYAGAFFTYTGAIVSHLTTGYDLTEVGMLAVLAALTVLSWALRPPAVACTTPLHREARHQPHHPQSLVQHCGAGRGRGVRSPADPHASRCLPGTGRLVRRSRHRPRHLPVPVLRVGFRGRRPRNTGIVGTRRDRSLRPGPTAGSGTRSTSPPCSSSAARHGCSSRWISSCMPARSRWRSTCSSSATRNRGCAPGSGSHTRPTGARSPAGSRIRRGRTHSSDERQARARMSPGLAVPREQRKAPATAPER